jgi:hypothetical protein
VASIGLDPLQFGTHSLRRTKAVAKPAISVRYSYCSIEIAVRFPILDGHASSLDHRECLKVALGSLSEK